MFPYILALKNPSKAQNFFFRINTKKIMTHFNIFLSVKCSRGNKGNKLSYVSDRLNEAVYHQI